jgi:gamma-F420-2:alpha-L-glutamate ligase
MHVEISSPDNVKKADIALLRNTKGQDYLKLKQMELNGTRFINKLDAHYTVSDKWKKYEELMRVGYRVPKTLLIPIPFDTHYAEKIGDEIGFPCVIKRRYGAHGIGVELCQDENELYIIARRFSKEFGDSTMLAQKYINYSGDYMALGWVNGIVRAHVAKAPAGDNSFLSYKKPEHLSSRKPYPITDELRKTVEPAVMHFGIELARLDILFDHDGYVICEINSPGGFYGFERVHNIDMGKIIADYVIGAAR